MAQIYEGLRSGDFPVRWGGGWARYGWPAPLFAQQTTSYVGALINFIVDDIVLSYNITVFFGALISTMLLYVFLRFYVGTISALTGTFVFHFAPYRIINIYVRGAIPEFYSSIGIILILIALYLAIEKKMMKGYYLLACAVSILLLTHPFMMVVGSFLFVPYGLFLIWRDKRYVYQKVISIGMMVGIGIGLAAYYLIPLFLEVKYLYYGGSNMHFAPGHFLTLDRFFIDTWSYFTTDDIAPRGHVLIGGLIEGLVVVSAIIFLAYQYIRRKKIDLLMGLFLSVATIYIVLMLSISEPIYQSITLLGNVQHPWRMLTGYILLPPILFAILVDRLKYKKVIFIVIVLIIAIVRFPQLYGKNYTDYSQDSYFVTDDNMHGTILNTVWMGEVRDYPYQEEKIMIIEGDGEVSDLHVRNSSRSFSVNAQNELKIVDYTFYFPGWKIFIDDQEVEVQFQDPAQRGVITYQVPAGEHVVVSQFTRTKPRVLGDVVSIFSLIILGGIYTLRKKISKCLPYAKI